MARPSKAVVDYFPLVCKWGDSIKYIEDTYGNDGFVCWVKLLQKLGRTEYHYFDWQDIKQRKILCAQMKLNEDLVKQILNELAEFDCIDNELWSEEIIFSENFVKSIKDAYKSRKFDPFFKKDIIKFLIEQNRFYGVSNQLNGVSIAGNPTEIKNGVVSTLENPQSKLKETILNQTIENDSIENKTSSFGKIVETPKGDDDFYKKLLSSLSVIEAYPFDEEADRILCNMIIALNLNEKKVIECINKWALQAMTENPLKNDPRTRLLGWVETCFVDVIKAREIKAQENKKKIINDEIKKEELEQIKKFDEEINNINSKPDAVDFLQKNVKPIGIFKIIPPFAKSLMAKFGLTQIEIWG